MNTFFLITGALAAGGLWGYWLGMVLHRDIPTKPDALTAEPREIVAVYEARLNSPQPPLNLRGGAEGGGVKRGGGSEKEIAAWEKEKSKKERRQIYGKEKTGRNKAGQLG